MKKVFKCATGKDIASLEVNVNDLLEKGYEERGIVQNVQVKGELLLILPMIKYEHETSGPTTR